ncbi:hypothetical protein F0562_001088 [Nyssa sinensis]|uniref:Uncharacterized protein n=1 Tax=Nyssa sinensis TaxID=561372 RepID=A0A5J5C2L7_9ASTE|nr:hypothetical protein F0562_001088 [Nyssa sinensis]
MEENSELGFEDEEVEVEEAGDVVGKALQKCAKISAKLRSELYSSSSVAACDRYAEVEASSVRIATQKVRGCGGEGRLWTQRRWRSWRCAVVMGDDDGGGGGGGGCGDDDGVKEVRWSVMVQLWWWRLTVVVMVLIMVMRAVAVRL